MFQTFSGSSRRPRQVNLSGQNINPFAASSWTPAASGTQKTVAHAQQERQQRQQEREKLNASKRIQRTWRGHKARRELADSRRRLWDAENTSGKPTASFSSFLLLFVAFFNPRRPDDIDRLESLSQSISQVGFAEFLPRRDVQPYLLRLAKLSLEAIRGSSSGFPVSILELLIAIIDSQPQIFAYISREYYGFLSKLAADQQFLKLDGKLVLKAIKTPLVERIQIEDDLPSTGQLNAEEMTLDAHAAFALYFLTTPNLQTLLGGLDKLAENVDVGVLSAAIVREFLSGSAYRVKAESRLWLLAHFIALHRLQQRASQDSQFLRGLSLQLSSSSTEIVGRIDVTETAESSRGSQNGDASPLALPRFIKNELSALVNQDSIVSLIARFDVGHAKNSAAGEEDASLLASYALSLLRIFPNRADELRMWLYLGSMDTPSGAKLPALKFFWQAVSLTTTFSAIMGDSKAALRLLRPQIRQSFSLPSPSDIQQDREWRTILLFLELYTFVLRFTDDEEFLSGSAVNLQSSEPISRIRESALPIEDVKRLTIFLKNLAFTSYFNAGELADDEEQPVESSLGSYFGTNVAIGRSNRFTSQDDEVIVKTHARRPFAGVAGMTFEYVRTVVTGVMRMLYERDSRRRFLPKDHWLMTSRFDMDGFITAVVMEEERRRELTEGDEDEDADLDGDDLPMLQDRLVGIDRHRRAFQIEKQRKQQQKAARKKVLAVIGPRVEVLQNMPFVIPFETRVQIFRQFVHLDQSRRRGGNVDPDIWRFSVMHQTHSGPGQHRTGREILGRHHAKIRRDNIFQDAYEQFYELGEGLKEPIQITFVDQFDTAEAGIDGGGVTKEFLTSVTNEAFRSSDGPNLFVTNDQNLLYPNPTAIDERQQLLKQAGFSETTAESREHVKELLKQYEFLGRVVGKCLYEGILIDISFAGFFLLKWAASAGPGYRASINDLRDLDEDFYQNLLKLKNFTGNVEDLSLDFTITDVVSPPGAPTVTLTRDLRPNGSSIAVTNENRPLYVSYVARHRLTVQPYQQTQAFLKGLGEIIEPSWLSMFNQTELQTLIGGDASEIDVDDLRANTAYGGVYQIGDDGLEHPTVQLFWRVMKQLDDSDRRKVLKYVTSTPRAPLLGFAQLNPRFSIRDAGADEERLPSTSTCVNLLKLPRYSTEVVLRNKLLYAVNSGAGFDLS